MANLIGPHAMAHDEYLPGQDLPGTVYRIVRLMGEGQGDLGRVYEVEDSIAGKRYALKTIGDETADARQLLDRLMRDSRSLGKIADPHVVEVRTAGVSSDGRCFYVMEMLDGEPLGAVLRREGKLQLDAVLTVGIELSKALASVHAVGVVHRDVKPDNIFVALGAQPSSSIKLLDLAVASAREGTGTSWRATNATFGYASPEQLRGEPASPLMDIWSLGCVLYEAASGRLPFEVSSDWRTFVDGVLGPTPAPRLSDVSPEAPADLVSLLARMLQKEPSRRLPRAEMATATLRRIERRLSSRPPPAPAHSSGMQGAEEAIQPVLVAPAHSSGTEGVEAALEAVAPAPAGSIGAQAGEAAARDAGPTAVAPERPLRVEAAAEVALPPPPKGEAPNETREPLTVAETRSPGPSAPEASGERSVSADSIAPGDSNARADSISIAPAAKETPELSKRVAHVLRPGTPEKVPERLLPSVVIAPEIINEADTLVGTLADFMDEDDPPMPAERPRAAVAIAADVANDADDTLVGTVHDFLGGVEAAPEVVAPSRASSAPLVARAPQSDRRPAAESMVRGREAPASDRRVPSTSRASEAVAQSAAAPISGSIRMAGTITQPISAGAISRSARPAGGFAQAVAPGPLSEPLPAGPASSRDASEMTPERRLRVTYVLLFLSVFAAWLAVALVFFRARRTRQRPHTP